MRLSKLMRCVAALAVTCSTAGGVVATTASRASATELGFVTSPAVGTNADGRLETFATAGSAGQVFHAYQVAPNSHWSSWSNVLGAYATGDQAVASNTDGRLELFIRLVNNDLVHSWQLKPNSSWSGFVVLAHNIADTPAVARDNTGKLELFARDTNNRLVRYTQAGNWTPTIMGPTIQGVPAVGTNLDGHLSVFARDTNNQLIETEQTTTTSWTTPTVLYPTISSNPAVGRNADGRLQVFARSAGGHIATNVQTTANGPFGPATTIGTAIMLDDFTTGNDANGVLEIAYRRLDGYLAHQWQNTVNGSTNWSPSTPFPGNPKPAAGHHPTLARNNDGRLEIFYTNTNNRIAHNWQTQPNGNWSTPQELPLTITDPKPTVADVALSYARQIASGNAIPATYVNGKQVTLAWNAPDGTPPAYAVTGGWGSIPGPADPNRGTLDCGGFTRWVYALATGADVLSGNQHTNSNFVNTITPVPGDLVLWPMDQAHPSGHVGIYEGGDLMIDTGSSDRPLEETHISGHDSWSKDPHTFRHFTG